MSQTIPECSPSVFSFPFLADLEKEDAWKASLGCVMPCVVVSKENSRQNHEVTVLPLALYHDSNGYSEWPEIHCTLWRPFFRNYVIDMPIKVGDTGWVIASDRGTDIIKQACRPNSDRACGYCDAQVPNSENTHAFRWGLFIPDRWGSSRQNNQGDDDYTLNQDDLDNERFVVQSADSKQRVCIGHEDIKIVSINASDSNRSTTIHVKDGTVEVETTGSTTVKCPKVDFVGTTGSTAFTIDGTLHVTGDTTIDGKLDVKREIKEIDADVTLSTHTHKETGVAGSPESYAPTTGT